MMTYEYDADEGIIHLRASGVLERDDPIRYFRELDEDPNFRPKAVERIYFTGLTNVTFSYEDVVEIKAAFRLYGHGDKISRGVFIVDSELTYGMARMVKSVFEGFFDSFTIERCDPGDC